jgi:hypothetical protein
MTQKKPTKKKTTARKATAKAPAKKAATKKKTTAKKPATKKATARRAPASPRRPSAKANHVAALPHEAIATRAYFLWQSRGGQPGGEMDDWLRAEAELRGELSVP